MNRRLKLILNEDWVLRADGQQLKGSVERIAPAKRVIRDEITGEPLPSQPGDAETAFRVEMRYALAGQPRSLVIRPPLDGERGATAANIGFVVYHGGVALNDFRYLAREETLQLDWEDPWCSAFESKTLRRRYFAPAPAFYF